LRKSERSGEKKRQPEQPWCHLGNSVGRQVKGKIEYEQQQYAEEKHRQQAIAAAQL
jgi:hypothetical protein